jgi:hypothetical protein
VADEVHRRFPSDDEGAGPLRRLSGLLAHVTAALARFAPQPARAFLHRVAEARGGIGRGRERGVVVSEDDVWGRRAQGGGRRAEGGGRRRRTGEVLAHARGHRLPQASLLERLARLRCRRRVRPSGAARERGHVVDVADAEDEHLAAAGARESAPLEARQVPSHQIELLDRRAAREEKLVRAAEVGEHHAGRERFGHRARAA